MEGCNSRQIPSIRNCFLSISCNLISFYLISLRRMKNLLLAALICISSLANAQTSRQRLEDLEDKLDLMRAEQDYKDAQRRIEQQNRGSVETPLQSYIRNRWSKIFSNENVTIYIIDKFISKYGPKDNPNIDYVFMFVYERPNYTNDGKPYFIVEGRGTIMCKKNIVVIKSAFFQDKNLNGISSINIHSFKTKGTLEEEIQKYLCR